MSYQTGTATSPTDLLQKLVTWLVGIGWSSDLSTADGAGWRAHLNLNSNHVHLRAAEHDHSFYDEYGAGGYSIGLYTSTSFNGSNAWNLQPGDPPVANGTTNVVGVGMPLPSGAIQNYHFLADAGGDNVAVVVERATGVFVFLVWGNSILKNGAVTGGAYFAGSASSFYAAADASAFGPGAPGFSASSYAIGAHNDVQGACSGFLQATVDSWAGKWIGISSSGGGYQGYTGKFGASSIRGQAAPTTSIAQYAPAVVWGTHYFQDAQTSELDARANLLPVIWWAERDGGGWTPIGALPRIFYTNGVGNGFAPAGEYSIGATTYKMFPNFAVVKD